MYNKITTSESNVQFEGVDGKVINVHPFHIYTQFNVDTVSFMLIASTKDSGRAIFTSRAEDLQVNGSVYSFAQLPSVLQEAFADAGAQARAEIVDELPSSGRTNTIYLVPEQTEEGTIYNEYIWLKDEQRWELIGDTSIEVARYVTKQTYSAYTAATNAKIEYLSGSVDTLSAEVSENAEVASNALNYLNNKLNEEIVRATSAETALSGSISDEASRASAAESYISGAVSALNVTVTAHTADTDVHVTTSDKATWNAVTAKTDNSAFTAHTSDVTIHLTSGDVQSQIDSSISGKADTSAVTSEISAAVSGKQDTLTAGNGIDITNNVISVTGGGGTVSTAITSGDTNAVAGGAVYDKFDEVEQVTARALNDLSDRFGGLSLVKLTQQEYDALTTKDANTLYVII